IMLRREHAVCLALLAVTGCGFFQSYSGYVDTPYPDHDGGAGALPPGAEAGPTQVMHLTVTGGDDGTNAIASVETALIEPNTLSAWTSAALPYTPSVGAGSTALPDAVVIGGGTSTTAPSSDVHLGAFSAEALTWTPGPSLTTPVTNNALAM